MANKPVRLRAPFEIRSAEDIRFFVFPADTTHIVVDLRHLSWISPVGVVALLTLWKRATVHGVQEFKIVAPRNNRVRTYLRHVGFLQELVRGGAEVSVEEVQPDPRVIRACLPVTPVSNEFEMEQAANSLQLKLMTMGAPPEVVYATYLAMTELTNNAWQHGSPCYVVAQTHTGETSGTPGLHLAIADFGDGFASSLSAYQPSGEAEAIRLAFEERVTSTGDSYRGFGLAHTMEAFDDYPGSELSVISGDAVMWRRNREFRTSPGIDCGGVFVSAYFPFTTRDV